MSNYSVNIAWSDGDEAFVAICPDLGGVSALGMTHEDALREIETVIELAVESYQERGLPVPEPQGLPDHSGQFRLRLPRSLHGALAARARREEVSLNSLVTTLLAEAEGRASEGAEARKRESPFAEKVYGFLLNLQMQVRPSSESTSTWAKPESDAAYDYSAQTTGQPDVIEI